MNKGSDMKAIVFSAYYEPEVAASLYLSTNLYEDMAGSGIDVNLFVPLPTRGVSDEVRNKYKNHKVEVRCNGRLRIHRIGIPKEGKSVIGRAARYILMNAVFILKSISSKADVIFVQSTPPTQGATAAIIKKVMHIPFVYNLQDVFPDSLVGTGIAKKGSAVYRMGRVIENFTYRNADKIIVISNDMKTNIMTKGVPESKIEIVNNWIDGNVVKPIPKDQNYMYEKFGLSRENFNVVYAGNLGYAQNIEVIIKAAEVLKDCSDIKFLIFGKGAQEEEYKNMAAELNLCNLSFFPIQPYSEVSYVYSLGDVSIVPCKKGFGSSAMPSKTWSIMAAGTPVLASFDSDTDMEKLINSQKVGMFNHAEDWEGLSSNIKYLYSNREYLQEYGRNARKYVEENISREKCVGKYIMCIKNSKNIN